jgi:hypothetical protein
LERGPQDWDAGPSLVDSLLRHKWLVALAVLIGVVAAYGWSARQPERYEATLELFPQTSIPDSDQDPDRILRNHVERLNSAAVLQQAVELSQEERPISRSQLKDSLSIEAAGDADVITIRVLDATPEGAKYLAELIPQAYESAVRLQASTAVEAIQKRQNLLEDELEEIAARLKANEGDLSLQADRDALLAQQRQLADDKRRAQTAGAGLVPPGGVPQADVGDEPAQPQPRRAAAVGGLLGLAISVALVSWRTGQQLRGGAAGARRAEIPEEVSRDLAILAEVDGSPNGQPQPSGDLRLLDTVSQELARPEPPWRRTRQPRERKGAPAKARATEVRGPAGGINDFNQLTASIQRIFRSLEGHRYRLYEQNVPQMAADDIANWFPVDLAVILLENDQGMLQVAGGVGLSSFEEHMTIEDNRELLLEVVEMGSKMVDEDERSRLAAANVPGAQAETLIVVPLIYDQVAFGMLLMGQRGGGAKQPALVEGDVDRVRAWARDISPYLRAWLLLRYLKLRLRMVQ